MVEKRGERRKPAKGTVWFVLEGAASVEFEGRLLDSSKSGFRAAHSQAALSAGQKVRFRHSMAQGNAVVMWTRILSPHVESGFLIVDE